jgi:hypothetical protein
MTYMDQPPPRLPRPSTEEPQVIEGFEFDKLAAHVLLTVQALQALHQAFDRRFTR